jgi:hypothetical protein
MPAKRLGMVGVRFVIQRGASNTLVVYENLKEGTDFNIFIPVSKIVAVTSSNDKGVRPHLDDNGERVRWDICIHVDRDTITYLTFYTEEDYMYAMRQIKLAMLEEGNE